MRDMMKMVVALTMIALVSGGVLAAVKGATADSIEKNTLNFVQGPTVKQILKQASNDPVADRFKMTVPGTGEEFTFFVGVIDGEPRVVAFETKGKGYGGDLGVMFAVDLESDKLVGIGVTTHSETPGIGARAKEDPSFAAAWEGLSMDQKFAVKSDGGSIDALTGATITSRGVTGAANMAAGIYKELKPELKAEASEIAG
ncbi:MAG: RnfABCDGE type electron transport complex subunit G [Desulfatibacillaceae bacterium]